MGDNCDTYIRSRLISGLPAGVRSAECPRHALQTSTSGRPEKFTSGIEDRTMRPCSFRSLRGLGLKRNFLCDLSVAS